MSGIGSDSIPLEELPRDLSEPQVSVPSLNIFLGSTPAYAALEAMRHLVYLPEEDRQKVALVFLDIDSPPAEIVQFRQEHPGVLSDFDLRISVAQGIAYADPLPEEIAPHTYIPTKIPESFDNGAGGIRNNGHVAACSDRAKIEQVLDEALANVGAIPNIRNARPIAEIQINIVAFLGGGTGSGILSDIAVMARHRVLQLGLKHRLHIFCLLPEHIKEATTNEWIWRRSNATATLLELVALSLAKGPREANGVQQPYTKYMLKTPYEMRGTTIANEVYLYGKTDMNSSEDAARIVGLELYSRMTNGSGVGYLERSKAVDRFTVAKFDEAGLPIFFATSCPMAVIFPAIETATAFAQMTAAKVLPLLAGHRAEMSYDLTSKEQAAAKAWSQRLVPPEPPLFTERQFHAAGRSRLDTLEARLKEQVDEAEKAIKRLSEEAMAQEYQEIGKMRLEAIGTQIGQLYSRKRIYMQALKDIEDMGIRRALKVDRDLQRRMLYTTVDVFNLQDRAIAAVTDDFNRVQRRNVGRLVLQERQALLERLLASVEQEIARLQSYQGKVESDDIIARLERAARISPAWNARLDYPHVHCRHLFDLEGMAGLEVDKDGSVPVSRLYELVTHSADYTEYAQEFTTWLDEKYQDGTGLLALGGEDLRDRLVQYLRDEVYRPQLQRMNLIELLTECCVLPGERWEPKVIDILHGHFEHMAGLARKLVSFESELWSEGSGNLNTSYYLGASWRNGAQKRIFERARDRLAIVGRDALTPRLGSAINPHRLEAVYALHAISMSTMPDYYLPANSSMGAFLQAEEQWFGDGDGTYGKSKTPVFSSGEMERLVMDFTALADENAPSEWRRPLPMRVIRRPQPGAGGRGPAWARDPDNPNGTNGQNGARPEGAPARYRQPRWD